MDHLNSTAQMKAVVTSPDRFTATQQRTRSKRIRGQHDRRAAQPVCIVSKPTIDALKLLKATLGSGKLSDSERSIVESEIVRFRAAVNKNAVMSIHDSSALDICRQAAGQIGDEISDLKREVEDRQFHLERIAAVHGCPFPDSDFQTPISALANFAIDLTNAATDASTEMQRLFALFYEYGTQGRMPSFEELRAAGKYDVPVPGLSS